MAQSYRVIFCYVDFVYRAPGQPSHVGVLAGTFNPVTIAHVALARCGLARVDEVVFALPRRFPHKEYTGPGFDERAALLKAVAAGLPSLSAAYTNGGLFIEIARECRDAYGGDIRVSILCGRDAAERVVGWDYGEPGTVDKMFEEFGLMVAARRGEYTVPHALAHAVSRLELDGSFDDVSASDVRRRIAAGHAWESLVPAIIREKVRRLYTR